MILSDEETAEYDLKNNAMPPSWHPHRFAAIYPKLTCYVDQEILVDNWFVDIDYLSMSKVETTKLAQDEYNQFITILKRNGLEVEVFDQETDTPDSLCTDWFMTVRNEFFPKGVLILAAMKTEKRRKERSQNIIDTLSCYYEDVIDLIHFQEEGKALELRGSLVWDWINSKIYCSLSQRSDKEVFEFLIDKLNKISEGYTGQVIKGITFWSYDYLDKQIYHTDIMLSILDKHIVICSELIKDEKQRENVIAELISPDLNVHVRQIIDISEGECLNMCGNIIFARDKMKNSWIIMSDRAKVNFRRENKSVLMKNYKIIKVNLNILEKLIGASAKSLLSEIN